MCLNFKCILGIQDRRHRLRSRPMYVLFGYGIQTFYTAMIIINKIITIIITDGEIRKYLTAARKVRIIFSTGISLFINI